MISNQLSIIHFKDGQRAELARAMARYQGEVTVIATHIYRPEIPGDWRRTLSLPNSANASGLDQREAIMVTTIRELAAKGVGISGMQKKLRADPRRIRTLARKARIIIPDARATQPRSLGDKARAALIDARAAKRVLLAAKLAPLAANGLTIQAMSDATGASKRTVMATINEHGIVRGPKMNLEA
ncbi:hypothetical protein [Pseudomonas sp. TMP25]|uniref:hypothetical protein n=1 Tax=Pseudomonas sp. TMP25 TaxID=3136561 RepID=UPI00310199C9